MTESISAGCLLILSVVNIDLLRLIKCVFNALGPLVVAIVFSALAGFLLGKLYQKIKFGNVSVQSDGTSMVTSEEGSSGINKLLLIGKYSRYFSELQNLSEGFFAVEHRLEKKGYTVKKLYLSKVTLSDIFKVVQISRTPSTYVTSWIEADVCGYVLYIQYE
jgi:hypothetical protein